MFTTLTPLAQEFSMDSRAVTPPKAVPYPTLVGTAMTGQFASQATSLAMAPSMPAIAMMTRAFMISSTWLKSRWMPETPTS